METSSNSAVTACALEAVDRCLKVLRAPDATAVPEQADENVCGACALGVVEFCLRKQPAPEDADASSPKKALDGASQAVFGACRAQKAPGGNFDRSMLLGLDSSSRVEWDEVVQGVKKLDEVVDNDYAVSDWGTLPEGSILENTNCDLMQFFGVLCVMKKGPTSDIVCLLSVRVSGVYQPARDEDDESEDDADTPAPGSGRRVTVAAVPWEKDGAALLHDSGFECSQQLGWGVMCLVPNDDAVLRSYMNGIFRSLLAGSLADGTELAIRLQHDMCNDVLRAYGLGRIGRLLHEMGALSVASRDLCKSMEVMPNPDQIMSAPDQPKKRKAGIPWQFERNSAKILEEDMAVIQSDSFARGDGVSGFCVDISLCGPAYFFLERVNAVQKSV